MKNRACPKCRENGRDKTGNHLYLMQDGITWNCNRCGYREGKAKPMAQTFNHDALPSDNLPDRRITRDTCEHYGVKVSYNDESGEIDKHFYPIKRKGKVTGYKIRALPKKFYIHGDADGCELFGQSSCRKGEKRLLITGGELDAMAAFQMLKSKYPSFNPNVVSLPKGENTNAIKENLEFINSFNEVLVYTDMDDTGRDAAEKIAKLIGPKAKIVETSEKDASDMLVNGKTDEFISAFYNAAARKPEGIVNGADVDLDAIRKPTTIGYDLPYPTLNRILGGLRKGELTTLTAGSGVGKSTLARELGYHLRAAHNLTVGNIFLEEQIEKTIQGYIAIHNNVPLSMLRKKPDILTDAQWQSSYETLIQDGWFGFKHFGSMPTEDLLDKMRYLAYGEGCDFIILDHLSMVFSGQNNTNERKDIDMTMTELAAFVNESGVGLIVVVHLSRNKGKAAFNEGGQISLNDLRGSAALEQLSWNVLGVERDQQDEERKNYSTIRVLKNRENGWTGVADTCVYNFDTGRLLPTELDNKGDF